MNNKEFKCTVCNYPRTPKGCVYCGYEYVTFVSFNPTRAQHNKPAARYRVGDELVWFDRIELGRSLMRLGYTEFSKGIDGYKRFNGR